MSIRRTLSAEMLAQTNKKGAFEDIWSSIQKNVGSGQTDHNSPPYVHPLVKRSTSLLTQKSLEVCTESLGSETGSDTGLDTVRCTMILSSRRSLSPEVVPTTTSFPPPLTSLSHREGSNLHMRAHRKDGRLVVEAVAVTVTVTAVKSLCAHRHDGRLLLTLNDDKTTALQQEEEKTTSYCAPSTLIMSKLTELTNCRWPRNMNTTIVSRVDDSHALKNAYDSYWKNVGPFLGPLETKNAGPLAGPQQNNKAKLAQRGNNNTNNNNNDGEEKMEKEEDYERIVGGCKRKSSLLLWDSEKHPTSFYIATS